MEEESTFPTITELNQWAFEAESCDKETFAQMRSSLLLIAGDHYARLNERFHERVRTSNQLSEGVKIRLTKNHIGRIHKIYVNNIMTYAPGVWIGPKNESDLSDQKAAELNNSVWEDAKERLNMDDRVSEWCDDFVGVSEVWTKCFFDPNAGTLKGYEQVTDLEGRPLFNKMLVDEPIIDPLTGMEIGVQQIEVDDPESPILDKTKPIFTGEIQFEEVHGFNVFRAPECKNLRTSPWYMIRKMVPVKTLRRMFPGEDKQQMIAQSSDRTFLVFDNANGGYRRSEKNECLVREFFMKPCAEYPEGYYWITTETGILDEGTLPFGIFPIECERFDWIQTSPRGRGLVRQLRPYQIEVNRCASKMAEHQMTIGDDKLIMFNGSKISSGGMVSGVRGINVQGGQAPTVLAGRNGSQYLEYMKDNIMEMYQIAMVQEDSEDDTSNGQIDPYAMLFKSASQKKRFKRYIARFESFLKRTCLLYLKMAKHYLDEDQVIRVIGKKEIINIAEFKNTKDIDVEIKVESRSDDIESMMGKQLTLNHMVQYAGTQLSREDLGKIFKQMPYANSNESFNDFTLDYDIATNLILALDRGQDRPISQDEPHEYIVKKLTHRMLEGDFEFKDEYVKMLYQKQKEARLQLIAEVKEKLVRDQAGLIPTSGALIDSGAWITDPEDNSKTKRLRMPQDSVYWLYQKLQDQGYMQAELNKMRPETQAQIPSHQGMQGTQMTMQEGLGEDVGAMTDNLPAGMMPEQETFGFNP